MNLSVGLHSLAHRYLNADIMRDLSDCQYIAAREPYGPFTYGDNLMSNNKNKLCALVNSGTTVSNP